MVVQLIILAARAASLNPTLRTIAMATTDVLRSRGLQVASMSEFSEAMVAAGYSSSKYLGQIAAVLF